MRRYFIFGMWRSDNTPLFTTVIDSTLNFSMYFLLYLEPFQEKSVQEDSYTDLYSRRVPTFRTHSWLSAAVRWYHHPMLYWSWRTGDLVMWQVENCSSFISDHSDQQVQPWASEFQPDVTTYSFRFLQLW